MGRPRNISLSPRVDAAIAERAEHTGDSFTRTIERVFDEADGNLQQTRHALSGKLNGIRLHAVLIRQRLAGPSCSREDIEVSLDAIIAQVNEAAVVLANPGGAERRKAVES